MSLGIALKSAEGIVLAADSRVTIFATRQMMLGLQQQQMVFPSTYDNANKILSIATQKYVGAVTFGAGVIGTTRPRTASSYLPEFEAELVESDRLSVQVFAERLSAFFLRQWEAAGMSMTTTPNENMIFFVGGYDEGEAYGRLFQISIPLLPVPQEMHAGTFGVQWGGQIDITARMISGFDPMIPTAVQNALGVDPANHRADLPTQLNNQFTLPIPFEFLPLQDCVDFAHLIVRTTIEMQRFMVAVRGVGGAVDLATITRTGGFAPIRLKQLTVRDGGPP
jgi:hypothetical protein